MCTALHADMIYITNDDVRVRPSRSVAAARTCIHDTAHCSHADAYRMSLYHYRRHGDWLLRLLAVEYGMRPFAHGSHRYGHAAGMLLAVGRDEDVVVAVRKDCAVHSSSTAVHSASRLHERMQRAAMLHTAWDRTCELLAASRSGRTADIRWQCL